MKFIMWQNVGESSFIIIQNGTPSSKTWSEPPGNPRHHLRFHPLHKHRKHLSAFSTQTPTYHIRIHNFIPRFDCHLPCIIRRWPDGDLFLAPGLASTSSYGVSQGFATGFSADSKPSAGWTVGRFSCWHNMPIRLARSPAGSMARRYRCRIFARDRHVGRSGEGEAFRQTGRLAIGVGL